MNIDGPTGSTSALTFSLEVVTLPVKDPDRSRDFYAAALDFALDVDYGPTPTFRVVQMTAPGSATSIQFGTGLTDAAAGSARGLYLVVSDLDATHRELTRRGVSVGPLRHKEPLATWAGGFAPGLHPERADYASFADFHDPDGNSWVIQERGHHS